MPLRDARTNQCEFLETSPTRCAIHRQLGADVKPRSCRHFPVVALLDAQGVSLTLSHYCPTAAGLLFRDDVQVHVVENPPSFPAGAEYEGLDARHVLPPLLRPGMLWDAGGYRAWEELGVVLLAGAGHTPEGGLQRLRRVAAGIETWTPSRGSLEEQVRRAFADAADAGDEPRTSVWGESGRVVNRYLAARLFASWVPYRAQRLMAVVDELERALNVLREEAAGVPLLDAIRAADLRIVHAVSGDHGRDHDVLQDRGEHEEAGRAAGRRNHCAGDCLLVSDDDAGRSGRVRNREDRKSFG